MTTTATELPASLRAAACRPVDGAGLAALRIAFGALMLVAVGRTFVHGWIGEHFLAPRFFFPYWGFSWVRPWPGAGMYLHFAGLGLLAACVMVGLFTRVATLLFTLGFAYAHLVDKTNYLNHYFLIVSVGLLGTLLPWHQVASWDAWRARRAGRPLPAVPAWALWAARAQLGLVYTFGGIAKLGPDWLVHAQPLRIWLAASTDFPILGALFEAPAVARAMSWAGALFDLSAPWLLLGRRRRPWGYALVVGFHLITARLFHLGMFPWLMIAWTPVFFDPSWPRRIAPRLFEAPAAVSAGRARWAPALVAGLLALQLLLPFRHLLYPGRMLWTEEGFRFSFNVMLMEKVGTAEFRVREPATGRTFLVAPGELFTPYQARMMATQPDMILQAAHALADEYRRRGLVAPEVRADVFVSLNGRPSARLVDPEVDLARQHDGLGTKPWILPAPTAPPPE
jgi:vitamin K-dependent gamma-carboxylase